MVSNMTPRREVGDRDTVQGVGVGIMRLDEKPRSFTWREKRNSEPGKRRFPAPFKVHCLSPYYTNIYTRGQVEMTPTFFPRSSLTSGPVTGELALSESGCFSGS